MRFIMRFGLMFFALVIFASAQTKDKKDTELKEVMNSFSSALNLIQHGILYVKMDEMYKGAQLLKKNEQKFMEKHGEALKEHLPDNPKFASTYATSSSKRIAKLTDRLNSSIGGNKDFSDIAATYGHIIQECVGCHQKLRRK